MRTDAEERRLESYRREEEGRLGGQLDYRLLVSDLHLDQLVVCISITQPDRRPNFAQVSRLPALGCHLLFVRAQLDAVSKSGDLSEATSEVGALLAEISARLPSTPQQTIVCGSALGGTVSLLYSVANGGVGVIGNPVVKLGSMQAKWREDPRERVQDLNRSVVATASESTSEAEIYLFDNRERTPFRRNVQPLVDAIEASRSLQLRLTTGADNPRFGRGRDAWPRFLLATLTELIETARVEFEHPDRESR